MRIRAPWEQTTQRVLHLFEESGYRVTQSFDLKSAKQGLQDPSACRCPNHGTEQCNCQYQVYLLYGQASEPISLVIHGHDEWTHLSIEPEPNGSTEKLYEKVHQLLSAAQLSEQP